MPILRTARNYSFGRFELRPAERRLLDDGKPVAISTRALDLLLSLVRDPGLVSKTDLLQLVWPDVVVEENTLQAQVSSLRKLLGADVIQTVSGRGYRFATPVRETDADAAASPPEDNLPKPATSFVGRDRESVELQRLLSRCRLLTITGGAGSGKTRLAIRAAKECRTSTSRDKLFVDLAGLSDGGLLATRLAATMGWVERSGRTMADDIAGRLVARPTLVILDGVDEMRPACGSFVDELLTRSPTVSFLVTSDAPIHVSGELTYPLSGLSLPDRSARAGAESLSECESAMLFIERARMLRPHFAIDLSNAASLTSICMRLEGSPLAIELVASLVRSMPPEEIDRQLESCPTQQGANHSLCSVIAWSVERLTPAGRAVLRKASMFSGHWTLDIAEARCTSTAAPAVDMLDILTLLADRHLIACDQHNGLVRYRMPEIVRRYLSEPAPPIASVGERSSRRARQED